MEERQQLGLKPLQWWGSVSSDPMHCRKGQGSLYVLCYCLTGTRFQSDNVSACCEVSVGTSCRGMWVAWWSLFRRSCSNSFLRRWHRAASAYHCQPRFFTWPNEPEPEPIIVTPSGLPLLGLVAVSSSLRPVLVRAILWSFTPVHSDQPAGWTCHARPGSQVTTAHLASGQWCVPA